MRFTLNCRGSFGDDDFRKNGNRILDLIINDVGGDDADIVQIEVQEGCGNDSWSGLVLELEPGQAEFLGNVLLQFEKFVRRKFSEQKKEAERIAGEP